MRPLIPPPLLPPRSCSGVDDEDDEVDPLKISNGTAWSAAVTAIRAGAAAQHDRADLKQHVSALSALRWRAVTVGVVSHGSSNIAGHGPGVTTLLTSASGALEPVLDERANLATILGLR